MDYFSIAPESFVASISGVTSYINTTTSPGGKSIGEIETIKIPAIKFYSLENGSFKNDKNSNISTNLPPVYSINGIVPGAIANIEYGYRVGYKAFREAVSRKYPPIFITKKV